MKRFIGLSAVMIFLAAGTTVVSAQSLSKADAPVSYNYGDKTSSTLTTKAWEALKNKDLDAVLAYTNMCVSLYAGEAAKMQAGLNNFPTGSDQEIFAFWALNDVATSLYIQGEAYYQAKQEAKAKEIFNRVVKEFSYGQAWDPAQKIFWKPVDPSRDKLNMMEKGLQLDFGDMTSSFMATQAWGALAAKNYPAVQEYVNKIVAMYGEKAKEMQKSLKEVPWESKDKIFSYWALNDVGTALFISGEAYRQEGKTAEAIASFQKLINEVRYAQCWDPQGWFWKPADAAEQKLAALEAIANMNKK